MRILWVKAGKLLPVDTGGKIRSFNLLRRLQEHHEITLLSYYFGKKDPDYEAAISRRIQKTVPLAIPSSVENVLGGALHYVQKIALPAPYAVTKFTTTQVQELLALWLAEKRFDVAVCDFLSASLNFPRVLETPTVLFQHNVESSLWKRQANHESNLVKRMAFRLEAAKMLQYERAAVRRFHHIISVSEEDRAQMAKMTDASRISVTATGVDLEQYRSFASSPSILPRVVFLGSMDWEANIDGVEFFCNEIWPRILSEVPDAVFRIVGRNPHARVRVLASPSVEVTGTVSSVIDYLRDAAAFVVPLRIGGGTRLKIYEAMAAGRAIVSTSVGAEGLDVHNGEDILLADTPSDFSAAVIQVLKNADERHRLGTAAARLAARYDWSVIAGQFADVLERVVERISGSVKSIDLARADG